MSYLGPQVRTYIRQAVGQVCNFVALKFWVTNKVVLFQIPPTLFTSYFSLINVTTPFEDAISLIIFVLSDFQYLFI